jgi:hypothetical protein
MIEQLPYKQTNHKQKVKAAMQVPNLS